jgi:hypothetical protein
MRSKVAQHHRRHEEEQVFGGKEPGAHLGVGHDEEEPVAAIVGGAGNLRTGIAQQVDNRMAVGAADQGGTILAGQQVAAVLIGENSLFVINPSQRVHKGLQRGPAAAFVSHASLFELKRDQTRIAVGVERRQECRAHQRNRQRAPKPQQDPGEQRIHSATASWGERVNW